MTQPLGAAVVSPLLLPACFIISRMNPYAHSKFSLPAPISKWHLTMPRSMDV